MDIQTIKERLTIADVLTHYGLQADKNNKLNCPFHDDRTPSLQVYPKTDTCYCFSSNCETHGKRIDVIDFIQHKEQLTRHQAIGRAKTLVTDQAIPPARVKPSLQPENQAPKTEMLQKLERTFLASIWMSKQAKDYCRSRALDLHKLKGHIGFNSGQFHHSGRFKAGEGHLRAQLVKDSLQIGMLQGLDRTNNQTGDPVTYRVFAKNCIVFFLKNKDNATVGLYGRSIKNNSRAKHYYLKNRQGLYPGYPGAETTHLIITESIIDCATLQHMALPEHYTLLALYGTNGFTNEHKEAIKQWASPLGGDREGLEIIFCLDNDAAGKKATAKYTKQLQASHPKLRYSTIALPNKDVNETAQAHEDLSVFNQLIANREPFLFSSEGTAQAPIDKQPPTNTKQPTRTNQLQHIDKLIAQSGIIGEDNNRSLLFIIASSYKTGRPLHAIVQGSSGSGKTHLISKIADVMPKEDVLRFTRITESALYNFSEDMLVGKLIVIEDLDGLKEEALLAFRELVSNHQVSSGVSIKDKKGNIKSTTKLVKGVFSSMSATTKGSIYEDNMNRSFLLAVDESAAQSQRIINYQNKRYAGEISREQEQKAVQELQQIIRNLQDIPVINPYATQLQLPNTVHKKRRLNDMFQSIIKQITFINQKQRPQKNGAIYTQLEDIELAIDILFDSIILKIDELEGTQRIFYETLFKTFNTNQFNRFEAMAATGLKKTQLQYHLNQLVQLEYLQQFGFSNRGFKYKISFEDSIDNLRKQLKQHFNNQLGMLKNIAVPNANGHQPNANRTPQTNI